MGNSLIAAYTILLLFYNSHEGEANCQDYTDLVANWALDGTDQDVILRNGASYISEDGITSLYLDGNGTYADTPSTNLYQFPAFTITCWVKVLEPASTPGYIYADWSRPHQFSIWINGNHKSLFFQLKNKMGQDMMVMYKYGVPFGVWIHLAVTWDHQRRVAEMFYNGSKKGEQAARPGRLSYEIMNNTHTHYQIGSKQDSGVTFHGLIRKMKVYRRRLNNSEILKEAKLFYEDELSVGCFMNPVGVSDPDVIPDSQITASSTLEQLESVHPSFGRLHGNRGDGWCSQRHDSNDDWLQVYFGDVFTVCGVETQGHVNADIWVTAFKLSFSTDGGNWTTYAYDNGTDAEFRRKGNSTAVDRLELPVPVPARYIRFHPTDRHNWNCLRVEVYANKTYHFETWLIVIKQYLTLDLLNSTSEQYKTMKTRVMAKFNGIVDGFPGFFFAEFQRFGPQSRDVSNTTVLLLAEIKIFCSNETVKFQLMIKVRTTIPSIPMFHNKYLEVVDTVNCNCPPATVSVNLSKTLDQAKVFYTTDLMQFQATVQHSQCSSAKQLLSYWHITKANLKSRRFYNFVPRAIERSGPVWSMYRRTSLDGYFYVSYVLRTKPDLRVIGYDYGFILVLQTPPVANISGISFITKGEGNTTLNGSRSYDPNSNGAESLTFTWFCRRRHETLPDNDSLPVIDTPDGKADGLGGCYGYGPGRLSGRENTITVDVERMEGDQTYVFELLVSNGVKSSRAVHQLTVLKKAFFISCIYNCGPEVIPSKRMIIESKCTGDLCGKITRHDWSLFKKTGSSDPWVQISDLAKRTLTELNNPSIVLTGKINNKEYSLEMNTTYKIVGSIVIAGDVYMKDNIRFKTVEPLLIPTKRCIVQPKEGFVLKTLFSVDCSGWHKENNNLTYKYSYITSTGMVTAAIPQKMPHISLKLPQGNMSEDFNVTIRVDISDEREAGQVDILTVQVKPLLQKNSSTIVGTLTKDIKDLVEDKKFSEAATLAIATLSSYGDDKAKDSTLQAMAKVQIVDVSQVAQLSAIVIMATEDRVEIPMGSLEDATTLLAKSTDFLRTHQDRDVVESVSENIFGGISNTLTASAALANKHYHRVLQDEGGSTLNLTQRGRRETEDVVRDFYRAKQVTENILSTADKLGTSLLSIEVPGQSKTTLESNAITMTLQRRTPSKIVNETFRGNEKEGAVTFPSMEVLFGRNGTNLTSIDTQMTTLQVNPYVWTNRSERIKSSILSLDLKKQDGSLLNISGLSDPIELFIPERVHGRDVAANSIQGHLFVKRLSNGSNTLLYHKIEIESDFEVAFVEIRPENNSLVDVFVSRGVKPTVDNYKFKTRIPDVSSCSHYQAETGYTNCTRNPYIFLLSNEVTGGTGVYFVGIRLLNVTRKASRFRRHLSRSCKDSHGRQKRSCIGVKDPPTTPPPTPEIVIPQYNAWTDVNYTMSVKIRSCLYWSEKIQAWTTDGCKVGWKIMDGKLHCLCTHLSAFGGNIFVAPNPIDFEKVWTEFGRIRETGNFVVLTTVCFIFGMYLLGLVAARRADKKDLRKVVANVYITNAQTEGYAYYLSIQTGAWKGFGTSAHVGIIINGENGSSGPITLSDPLARRKYFSRGSVNNFTLTLPTSLGKLTDICIWHDNTGSNPAWFLQQVVITDQETEEMWYFFVNKWLALDNRRGSIEVSVEAAKQQELAKLKHLFYARTARGLGDGHIWISVFTRPPQNPFTRCQRLTCCLAFLFAAMVTNAMFYQFDRTPTDTFKFGPLVMSWTQIKIGIQSSMIAIPANVLVVLIFRNAKQTTSDEVYDPGEGDKKPKTTARLPPFFVYVAWCLSLIISLTGAAFTVFYSLMWGADTSNKWLTSILVSLVQDILITQPIKVFALAGLLSLLIKKPPEQDPIFGASLFQSKKGEHVMTKRKGDEELAGEKDTSRKKWSMLEAAKEALSFAIFNFLLMAVCYGGLHPTRFQFTKSTRDIFGSFDKVEGTSSLWNWVDETLLPGLYDVTWYNGRPFEYKEGFISNKKTFLIGMPRLRQLRLKPKTRCQTDLLHTNITDLFPGCLRKYSTDSEDVTPYYLPKWIKLENYSHFTYIDDICPKPWRYQSGSETQTLPHDSYDGGGYVADLGYNEESASKVIKDLRENNWVDAHTAAVFIEFTLFDPSTSLFCSVRLVYERLLSGKAVAKVDVRALSVFPSPNIHWQSFYEVCQLLFLVVIVVCFIVEVVKLFRQKRYFRYLWNWVEMILLVVCLVVVVMSFLKGKYTSLYVKNVKSNPYETFSSDYIVRWLDRETMWLSIAIFIVTLKFLRLIRFNHHICQMQGTLKRSARPIISFSLLFVIAVIAFSHFGVLGFGASLEIFSSFLNSLRVVLQMSVGKQIDYLSVYLDNPVVGSLYLFLFLVTIIFFLINIFIAVLVDAYGEVREEQGEDFFDAELGTFMYNVLRKIITDFPGLMRVTMKSLFKKLSIKPLRNYRSYNIKHSDEMKRFIESREDETGDDIPVLTFRPTNDMGISPGSPTFKFTYPPGYNTDKSDNNGELSRTKDIVYEDDFLDDIKALFMEMVAELESIMCFDVTDPKTETRV